MKKLIREFPFATTFALAGFLVGISVLFSLDFFISYDFSKISENPVNSLIDYIRESLSQIGKVLVNGVFLGFVLGLIFGLGGFIIDFLRKKPDPRVPYSKRTEQALSRG